MDYLSPYLPVRLTEQEQKLADQRRKVAEPTEEKAHLAPVRKEAAKLLSQYKEKVGAVDPKVRKIRIEVEELMLVPDLPIRKIFDLFSKFDQLKDSGAAVFSSITWGKLRSFGGKLFELSPNSTLETQSLLGLVLLFSGFLLQLIGVVLSIFIDL